MRRYNNYILLLLEGLERKLGSKHQELCIQNCAEEIDSYQELKKLEMRKSSEDMPDIINHHSSNLGIKEQKKKVDVCVFIYAYTHVARVHPFVGVAFSNVYIVNSCKELTSSNAIQQSHANNAKNNETNTIQRISALSKHPTILK